MNAVKLDDLNNEIIRYGSVFRFPGGWPYEHTVDLLLTYFPGHERESVLVVATGHKAGLIAVMLPEESGCDGAKGSGVLKNWALKNWNHWVWPNCHVNDVYVINRYDVPARPATGQANDA